MKKYKPVLLAMGVVIVLLVGYLFFSGSERGRIIAEKENEEFVTEDELFGVSGNEIRIIYNNYPSDAKGIVKDGAVYLPLDWAADNLNDKFYLDRSEGKVIYTYPDRVSYIDHASKLSSGEVCLINSAGTEYISLNLVAEKTPVLTEAFTDTEHKRVFIEDYFEPYRTAVIGKKDAEVREGKSLSDRRVTDLAEGDTVQLRPEVWESDGDNSSDWVRIRTSSGFLGYIKKKTLGDIQSVTPSVEIKEEVYTSIRLPEQVLLGWHLVSNYDTNGQPVKEGAIKLLKLADEDFPLQNKAHTNEFLREIAHLKSRATTTQAIQRIRTELAFAIHNFFHTKGFIYLATPLITSNDCEGAGENFIIKEDPNKPFFGGVTAGLTVSGQLNAESYALGMKKVYTFGPTFRAERSHTNRPLAEF